MSYEVISGIKYNSKKEIIEFKSHSNNDDADPTWWVFAPNKSFNERLQGVYIDMWEGNISINGHSGQALRFNYAYIKYNEYLKKQNEECNLSNIKVFKELLDEKDYEDKIVKIGRSYYATKWTKAGLEYSNNKEYAKVFTHKELYLLQRRFKNESLHFAEKDGFKKLTDEETKMYEIIFYNYESYLNLVGCFKDKNGDKLMQEKARACLKIIADYECIDIEDVLEIYKRFKENE